MIKYGQILVFILFGFTKIFAQLPCDKSTVGRDFYFGFMENRNYQVPQYPFYLSVVHYTEVTLISEYQCKVDIYIGKSSTPNYSRTVLPNIPLSVQIPWPDVETMGSETIQEKAIHLVSDNLLNVYAMNWCENSSDVAVIFPKESIGTDYYTMCYQPHIDSYFDEYGIEYYRSGRNSEFLIVATENNTKVTINPSKVTDKNKPANLPFYITLNKGEVFQVQSMNHANLTGQGDLTGSRIQSDKPVAVYSGALATTVPADANVDAWDHLYEQMPPVPTWGKKFITVPLKGRSKDVFRVMASQNNTTVRIGSRPPVLLNQGAFYEFVLNENEPALVESNRPVLLAQFMVSNSVDRPSDHNMYDWDGDPFMVIVSPVDQTRESVTFVAYDSKNMADKFYVNVVTKDDATKQVTLDGNAVPFQTLLNSGYSLAQVKITKGSHKLKSTESGKGFIAYVYGYGSVESYGYGVGFNLNYKLDLGGDPYFVKDTLLLCKGASRILDAGPQFASYLWNTGETTQKISVNKKGYYKVTASSTDGCSLSDSIYVFESNPVINLGKDSTYCQILPVTLDAGPGFTSYNWSDKETTQKITVKARGVYTVLAVNKYGCSATDNIRIDFSPPPKLILNKVDQLICGSKSTTVQVSNEVGQYALTSSNPAVVIKDLTITVPQFGIYPFKFTSSGQYGCKTDTSFSIGFYQIPDVNFDANDTTCYGSALEVKYVGNADRSTSRFTWIFANDTVKNGIGFDKIQLAIGKNQKNSLLYLKVNDKGCSNYHEIREIKVIPDLNFVAMDTLVCEKGEVKFSAISSGNMLDYLWEWGDGTSEHQQKDATHIYQKQGQYNVQLTVAFDNKCSKSIRKENYMDVKSNPTVGFSIQENQCLNAGNQTLYCMGSGDEIIRYDWDLSGLAAEEIIQPPGNSSGPLLFNLINHPNGRIAVQVVSKYGCISENKSLNVKRNPIFTIDSDVKEGCTPLTIRFKAKTGDPVDQVDYQWDLDKAGTFSGDEIVHTYLQPNQYYNLSVKAVSKITGCSDFIDQKNFIQAYPNPKAGYSVTPEYTYDDQGEVSFLDQSQDAVRYTWDFGDGSGSAEKNPVHKYNIVGIKAINQTVYNKFGCSDKAAKLYVVALSKLYPPTAFSTNALNPVDREFKLFSNGIKEEGYHLKILSRWNDVVFECKNEIKAWNGRMLNGEIAPSGNYIWILEFIDFAGNFHRQTGTVMLVN